MARIFGDGRRLFRLVSTAVALAATFLAAMLIQPWLRRIITPPLRGQLVIGFLVAFETIYAVLLVAGLIGTAASGVFLYGVRSKRISRSASVRGFMLCVGCLLALVLAEVTAAARQASLHRSPAVTNDIPALEGRFAEPTERDEMTLAVLGDSSAIGVPYESWLSVGKIVAWQLEQAIPGKRFRIELLAELGDSLAGQVRKLAGVRRRPDVLIVYCGHNEIPGAPRLDYYLDDNPALYWGLCELAGAVSPLCALIRETADRQREETGPRKNSLPPVVEVPVYTPAELRALRDGFQRRLDAIAVFGARIGALVVLVVAPSNDGGFDPNRSFLPAETPRPAREAFARDFLAARQSEAAEPARAVGLYRTLLDRQPGFAETHYRLGVLLDRAGAWDEAYRHFVAARDLDGMPTRCLSSFQESCRAVAARHHCILVDGQALFRAIAPHGILDDHMFQDAVHPSLRGHVALAQGILEALYARRAFGWPEGKPSRELDPARCAAHSGLEPKDWQRLCGRGVMFYWESLHWRSDRTQRLATLKAFELGARRLAAGDPPEAIGLPNIGIPAAVPVRPECTVPLSAEAFR
jgi:hypothetical protein